MRFTKIISSLLALGALLMLLSACQNIKKTQLVLFESLSFGMSPKSFEEVLGKASEVEEEKETAYRDTWRAEDPYFYKTGRLFYHYEQITLKGYTGRATFTFSKSHHLETVAAYFPVTSKAEQEALLDNLSQTIKKELEELPDYQSMTTDTLGIYDDGYRYKVKLKGKQWELWVDVYPTENKYATDTETDKYTIRVDQFLMYP
ncbi:hypothetical protein NMM24_07735 [Streptococcus oralis]|jgi:hypothetical protein|uniref:Lipoprotein n=1 Tax=Streptococcus oralis subsp. oralis TaxID=1891914 RepID=A0A7H9FH51_STROR|nr:hypothetical protein [Streptococcus oralis]MBK3298379.1 hypothetical protein [Streptococcus oralis]MCP9126177.1 hypothetical protein [Streptococcus oralis]MDU3458245.1 hypothetical protein [Streptococcus oralis]PLA07982.1 hypothetical protein CYK17_06910 [Streptococcus oralis subsp. dentisani]QLL97920.1 hypothetical protein HRE59_02625 [Streptococcus oralis subsp. oralis]